MPRSLSKQHVYVYGVLHPYDPLWLSVSLQQGHPHQMPLRMLMSYKPYGMRQISYRTYLSASLCALPSCPSSRLSCPS